MRFLFVKLKTKGTESKNFCDVPPIGLWSMRSTIQMLSREADVDICDMHMGDSLEEFLKNDYDLIGVSAQFSAQHSEYIRVVKLIKELNTATIIAGGPHASLVERPDEVAAIVTRNGEEMFFSMFGKKFKNIDDIPYPLFSIEEMERYWKSNRPRDFDALTDRWFSVETSRGCGRNCGFCMSKVYWAKRQEHSIEWCKEYFEYLKVARGIKEVFIEDDNITQNKDRFIELVRLLKKMNLYWSAPNGIPIVDISKEKVFNELKDSTCWKLSLPFETGVKSTSKLMRLGTKFIEFNEATEIVNKLRGANIKTVGFFIIGYPGETLDDIRETLRYANNLPLDGRHIHIATPYKGSDMYRICEENGYFLYDDERMFAESLFEKCLIKTPEFTPEQIEEIRKADREEAIARRKRGEF